MKKRKIFIGLALASAALFSLAACNNNGEGGASTSVPAASTSAPAESTSAPAASTSTPAQSSSVVASDFTATYVAMVDGTRDNDLLSKTATSTNGKFSAPTDAEMAIEGYQFQGFYSNVTLTTAFDFNTAVTKNTTIYVKYHKMTKYDELVTDNTHNLAKYDFEGTVTPTSGTSFGGDSVALKADTTKVTFNGSSAILKTGNVLVDLGTPNYTKVGLYKIYFEVSFKAFQGEAFFQIDGSSAAKTDTEVFALRTSSSKFHYRFDGGSDVALGTSNSATVDTNYQFYIELDTSAGKISIYRDGEKIIDEAATTINKVRGIKFTCKDAGTSEKTIDNVAVNLVEQAKSELTIAKEGALATIDSYIASESYTALGDTAGNTSANAAKKKLIDAQIATSKAAINAAESVDAVNTASSAWATFASANKYVVTVEPYTAASTRADAAVASYYVAVVSTGKINANDIAFAHNKVTGLFSDEALATAFDATTAEITEDKTVYAQVAATVEVVVKADDDTATEQYSADSEIVDNSDLTLKTVGIKADLTADMSTATANDGSGKTFAKAWVPTGGGSDSKYFEITAKVDMKVTVYFTATDSSFATKDQAKGGELVVNGTQVTTVAGNKDNKVAYAYTFNVTAGSEPVKLWTSANRLALFAIVIEK